MNLFTPVVEEHVLHPLFKKIIRESAYQPVMDVINEWSIGLLERKQESTKFVNEFQTTFNSSFWEIYLNKAFMQLGYEIDYSKKVPTIICYIAPAEELMLRQ